MYSTEEVKVTDILILLLYDAVCFQSDSLPLWFPYLATCSSYFLIIDGPYQEVGGETVTALSKQPKGQF